MARTPILAGDKIDLEKVSILMVDDNQRALDLLFQVITGFGAKTVTRCESPIEAVELIKRTTFDLIITECQMQGMDGYSLISWLRRDAPETNRFVPAFLLTGHTREQDVYRARDCGANYTILKPITPKVILDRVFWVAREDKAYVESESYCGPDRRTRRLGPPPGMKGRREEDNNFQVGDASEPNMSQDAIDALMKPQKAII